jgi:hypothetical protein
MTAHIINDPAELLEATAEEIEIHGWCTDKIKDQDGRLCVLGGMRMALYGTTDLTVKQTYQSIMRDARDMFWTNFGSSTSDWNDCICTDVPTLWKHYASSLSNTGKTIAQHDHVYCQQSCQTV